jgi:CheY-like chemotaxis protein
VLKNLLSNAVKFTKQGSVNLSIFEAPEGGVYQQSALQTASRVFGFRVSDTGIGINHEQLALIFEAFQQADGTTSRKFGGTGLGLSISREIARILGGEIRVASTHGEGSTFTLYLPENPPGEDVQASAQDSFTPSPRPSIDSPISPPHADQALPPAAGNVIADIPQSLLVSSRETLPTHNLQLSDDRDALRADAKLLMIVEDDPVFADILLSTTREQGYQVVVSARGDETMKLAEEYQPHALILDLQLPGLDGMSLLERLKSSLATRHIPVYVISGMDRELASLASGAIGYLEKPATSEAITKGLAAITEFVSRKSKRLLLVEDDPNERLALTALISGQDDIEVISAEDTSSALKTLKSSHVDCVVLDLTLKEGSGLELLEAVKQDPQLKSIPVIVHTGRDLTEEQLRQLEKYAETIILKNTSSPERLLDETALYLHRNPSRMSNEERAILEQLHFHDDQFKGKRVLIVDDDARNAFALTNLLEAQGLEVAYAENGIESLDLLANDQPIDLVLMDIMMPEMDGFEATRAQFADLPIITLTAKAMKEDRENSMDAGASDYVTKPVDVDQLLSLIRVWLLK